MRLVLLFALFLCACGGKPAGSGSTAAPVEDWWCAFHPVAESNHCFRSPEQCSQESAGATCSGATGAWCADDLCYLGEAECNEDEWITGAFGDGGTCTWTD